jgi:hypothetical protein
MIGHGKPLPALSHAGAAALSGSDAIEFGLSILRVARGFKSGERQINAGAVAC